jgi:hypothetical protein
MINKMDNFKGGVLNSIRGWRTNMANTVSKTDLCPWLVRDESLKKYDVGA